MNHTAPRRDSHGVIRRQHNNVVPTRTYDNTRKTGPNKWSRNLVWTSNDFRSSHTNNHGAKPRDCVCKYWKAGKCNRGDQCRFLHSWSSFPGSVMVSSLDGHNKELKGIALPIGSDKLFSASSDGTLRIWDCHSGHCVHTINLQTQVGSLISEGPWVFLGLTNAVKAYNVQTGQDLHLDGVVTGQVNAMTVGKGMLFAGTSSGSISVWKANNNAESDPFVYLTSLQGHSGEVTCFIVGGDRLYSGSVDRTIKAWDLETLKCTMTLRQHTDTVTSLLCWDDYLLSSSLDGTINVWAFKEENSDLKVVWTRRQEQSVHALCGMGDAEGKPILFSSYRNGVGIYDLPSFEERGKMFSANTVGTMSMGPQGLFFTGDKSGMLRVWNLGGTKV